MIFQLKPKTLWVAGDDPVFDTTEIGGLSTEERAKVKFELKLANEELMDQLRQANTKIEARTNGKREENFDLDRYTHDLFDSVVVGWDGLLEEDGKPIPCTQESRRLLQRYYGRLCGALIMASSQVSKRQTEELNRGREEMEKNSEGSQSGNGSAE